jgi:hypothetical protein
MALMRDRIQEAPLRAGLNGARSFVSAFAPRAGLVTLRQTFVRRSQNCVAWAAAILSERRYSPYSLAASAS